MESTPLDCLHLLTKCHVTQVCAAAAAPLRNRFQTIRKMQRRESAARKAVAPQIFQAIRQVDMLQALAARKRLSENGLDRLRQDHLRDGRVLEHFLADADDRQPADLRRNDNTLRIKPGVGRDPEPLADQLLQRTLRFRMFRTIPRKSIGRSPRLRHVLKAARIGRCIQHRPELSRDRLLCRALFRCFFPRFRGGCQTLFRRFLRCLHGRCRTALRSHLFLRLRIRHLRSPLFFQRILQRLHSGFQSLNAPLIIKNHRCFSLQNAESFGK